MEAITFYLDHSRVPVLHHGQCDNAVTMGAAVTLSEAWRMLQDRTVNIGGCRCILAAAAR